MPTKVTRDWTKARIADTDPQTASEVYHVSGSFSSDGDALTAVDSVTGEYVRQRGAGHDYSAALVCKGPQILECKSPLAYYVIGCQYDETAESPGTSNPLAKTPTWTWETVYVSEMTDRDARDVAITNTAMDPVQVPRDIFYKRLHFQQVEAFYDIAKCEAFENRVNSHEMIIAGQRVEAEHCRLVTALPVGEQSGAQTFTRMSYIFEIVFGDQLGSYPFQHRFLNQGDYGWWNDGGTKRRSKFSDGKGNLVDGPIRLAWDGTPVSPLHSANRVGKDNAAAVAPAAASGELTYETMTNAVWLYYSKCLTADLRLLGLR